MPVLQGLWTSTSDVHTPFIAFPTSSEFLFSKKIVMDFLSIRGLHFLSLLYDVFERGLNELLIVLNFWKLPISLRVAS